MNLTDKAREDFLKYISYRFGESENDLRYRFGIYVNTLIIEWLDSVGIFIDCPPHSNSGIFFSKIVSNSKSGRPVQYFDQDYNGPKDYPSRKEAIDAAIIKANEIYNSIKS